MLEGGGEGGGEGAGRWWRVVALLEMPRKPVHGSHLHGEPRHQKIRRPHVSPARAQQRKGEESVGHARSRKCVEAVHDMIFQTLQDPHCLAPEKPTTENKHGYSAMARGL